MRLCLRKSIFATPSMSLCVYTSPLPPYTPRGCATLALHAHLARERTCERACFNICITTVKTTVARNLISPKDDAGSWLWDVMSCDDLGNRDLEVDILRPSQPVSSQWLVMGRIEKINYLGI